MILKWEYDGIMICICIAKLGYFFNSLLEIDWLAKWFTFEGMIDDRYISIIVNIDLYTLESPLQVLKIPFYLTVTGKLVSTQVSVVGRVAKIVSQG